MKIPNRYRKLAPDWPLELELDAEGYPAQWPDTGYYPPLGFLPIQLFESSDVGFYGFYWPIGREGAEPIICALSWLAGKQITPEASSLEGLVSSMLWRGLPAPGDLGSDGDDDSDEHHREASHLAQQLGIELLPQQNADANEHTDHLSVDPMSPLALKDAALAYYEAGDLEQAERHLHSALAVLPEYTEALFHLATLYRRTRRLPEAAQKMLQVLSAPICFGGERDKREKCLQWLRRMRDDNFPELTEDPLWRERHNITLAYGVKRNDDYLIYERAIAEYLARGKGMVAVRLRTLVGELMSSETVSFRERYDYPREKHVSLLKENLQAAGLAERIRAIKHV